MDTRRQRTSSDSSFGDDSWLERINKDKKSPASGKETIGQQMAHSYTSTNIKRGVLDEDSDESPADVDEMLKEIEDLDELDAKLFSSMPGVSSAKTKLSANVGPKKESDTARSDAKAQGKDESTRAKEPDSAKKKVTFVAGSEEEGLGQTPHNKADDDDDLPPDEPKFKAKFQLSEVGNTSSPLSASPVLNTETPKAVKNRAAVSFGNNGDDLIDTLGFDGNNTRSLWPNSYRDESPQRPRTQIDDILESLNSQPPTGEKKQVTQSQEKKQQEKRSSAKELLTLGSYQPSTGPPLRGRSDRPSVRVPSEDLSFSAPEKKPNPTASSKKERNADWLELDAKPTEGPVEASSSPLLERRPTLTSRRSRHTTSTAEAGDIPAPTENITKEIKQEASKHKQKEEVEEDWLVSGLKRTKSASQDILTFASNQPSTGAPLSGRSDIPSVSNTLGQASHTPSSVEDKRPMHALPHQSQVQNTQTTVQQPLLSLGGIIEAGDLPRANEGQQQPGDYQGLQARIFQLDGQVKTLQMERDQIQMLLENIQQKHKQDMELIENTHKARVKMLEDLAAYRETQAQQECEDLKKRLNTVMLSAEQERSELQAQNQVKLAQAHQERDLEVERLKDLQRKSILELKKEHEDEVQRLKKLKDEEIDAATRASSETRVVMEEMRQISSGLKELYSRVETTNEHKVALERGTWHRDEQLRLMQERLTQQQKDAGEERASYKEIICGLQAELTETQRQLEKERWKVTAEQANAESAQRSWEKERQVFNLQISAEKEELEKAKSLLLEEQKSVQEQCAAERRMLAAEWDHFRIMDKQKRERAEKEVNDLLDRKEVLANERAELKVWEAQLKERERAVAEAREVLDRLRQDLDRKKEIISGVELKLKRQVQEVEDLRKVALEKHKEGERALQEAKNVEAEHKGRLTNIQLQTEQLRQQEQRIMREQKQLNFQKTEEQRRYHPVTSLPQRIPSSIPDPGSFVPNPVMSSTMGPRSSTSLSRSQSAEIDATLAVMKYKIKERDEFLQQEAINNRRTT